MCHFPAFTCLSAAHWALLRYFFGILCQIVFCFSVFFFFFFFKVGFWSFFAFLGCIIFAWFFIILVDLHLFLCIWRSMSPLPVFTDDFGRYWPSPVGFLDNQYYLQDCSQVSLELGHRAASLSVVGSIVDIRSDTLVNRDISGHSSSWIDVTVSKTMIKLSWCLIMGLLQSFQSGLWLGNLLLGLV